MKQAEGQGMCCSTGHGLKLTKVTQIRSAIECIVSMRIYSITCGPNSIQGLYSYKD